MHFLLARTSAVPTQDIPVMPERASYDLARGYWILGDSPLAQQRNFAPVTKKADQETGEDQKGE